MCDIHHYLSRHCCLSPVFPDSKGNVLRSMIGQTIAWESCKFQSSTSVSVSRERTYFQCVHLHTDNHFPISQNPPSLQVQGPQRSPFLKPSDGMYTSSIEWKISMCAKSLIVIELKVIQIKQKWYFGSFRQNPHKYSKFKSPSVFNITLCDVFGQGDWTHLLPRGLNLRSVLRFGEADDWSPAKKSSAPRTFESPLSTRRKGQGHSLDTFFNSTVQ